MSVRILLLEDDSKLRVSLLEALEDGGYSSQGASCAEEALEAARQSNFDLVISDVRMAGAQDGLGALEILKERHPELRCLVITGFASQEAPVRALKIMVDDYLYKPFSVDDMLAVVERVLRSGEEKASYQGLLAYLWQAPRKLLEKVEQSRREAAHKGLQQQRERCVQGFYLGIRANHLSQTAALEAWDRLEGLEIRQEEPGNLSAGALQDLQHGYSQLFEKMTALARSQALGSQRTRGHGQIDLASFNRFYDRVKAGQLTPEQLLLASWLRRSTSATRMGNPELQQLFAAMWL